jgi:hypothetical protein
MREYGYTVTEHDAERPWIVLETSHETVALADGVNFFDWVQERWPAPRWSIELDPHELTKALWSR